MKRGYPTQCEGEAQHRCVLDEGGLFRREPIEPGTDDGADAVGYGQLTRHALELERTIRCHQLTRVDEHANELDGM